MNALDLIRSGMADCHACDLRRGPVVAVTPVFGRGNPSARLVIVGEAPGPAENRAGQVFVGPSGQIVASLMRQAGIDPAKVWITNAIGCWPHQPGGRAPKTVPPTQVQLASCVPRHLEPTLDALANARVILTLGATAASATFARESDDLVRLRKNVSGRNSYLPSRPDGAPVVHEWRGRKVFAAWHPAFLARRGYQPDTDAAAHPDARLVLRTMREAWAAAQEDRT